MYLTFIEQYLPFTLQFNILIDGDGKKEEKEFVQFHLVPLDLREPISNKRSRQKNGIFIVKLTIRVDPPPPLTVRVS